MVSYGLKAEHLYVYTFSLIQLFHEYRFLQPLSMLSFSIVAWDFGWQ